MLVLAMLTKLRTGSLVMMLTTPAIAFAPYIADPPPRITSMRSIIAAGTCSRPYTEAMLEKTGRLSMRICVYWPCKPLMRSSVLPQFEQVFSTRRPGWKFNASATQATAVVSNSLGDSTLTIVAAS